MTGSAVMPFVESPGFAQLYIRFYRTNDNHSDSAQVNIGQRSTLLHCTNRQGLLQCSLKEHVQVNAVLKEALSFPALACIAM